jgi:hypothetical protein
MKRLPKIIGERKYSELKTTIEFIGQWYDLNPSKWDDFRLIIDILTTKLN